ncbi:hypothetical protein BZB76_1195 [Actinomadura pelletieri DSM 43383]|uniref:Uncharacterized protein n=1 Tax=Actinomadura pelletieri DSM 43383 TaxID=1120940 RepID=A0A495R092_9ACTN|nr:hypothetical protein [Actinomadura pelletieri]RKS79718.1 hypothetical protein BZB76_1195 [Actinomadura pelletieri DSM 43383]
MGYDIEFMEKKPGQSWEEAMDAWEARAEGPDVHTRPPNWDLVVTRLRELLGDISVEENPPEWEIYHSPAKILVSCISGEWSLSVPYWFEGDAARSVTERILAICEIIESATGLRAHDPQLGEAVLSEEWTTEQAASMFDLVAGALRKRARQTRSTSVIASLFRNRLRGARRL